MVLRNTANVREAARRAHVVRATAFTRRRNNAEFAAEWAEAIDEATEALELIARKRAEKTSDTLMIFLLKAYRPEIYRERYEHKHTGTLRVTVSAKDLSDDELATIIAGGAT